jgi:hypothetical protein
MARSREALETALREGLGTMRESMVALLSHAHIDSVEQGRMKMLHGTICARDIVHAAEDLSSVSYELELCHTLYDAQRHCERVESLQQRLSQRKREIDVLLSQLKDQVSIEIDLLEKARYEKFTP